MKTGAKSKTSSAFSPGGDIEKRISEFDWTQTPLGHPDTWSKNLKEEVIVMLVNRFSRTHDLSDGQHDGAATHNGTTTTAGGEMPGNQAIKPLPQKPCVLLAEDDTDMRELIRRILEEYCDVHAVPNGKVAFEVAQKISPDLVLSDVMMPETNGFQLLHMLRADAELRHTPVILLSGRVGEDAKVEGLLSGADDYLTKPFTRSELIARVNASIQRSRIRTEVENAVRHSEAQLRALVTATSDVLYRMSADWKVMRQLDGRNFLQSTGAPISDWQERYIHPKDRTRVWLAIQDAIQNKTVFQLDHQVIRADGTLGWTFSRAVPILDKDGNILEWFGAASDISPRKQHETDLEVRVEDRTRELNRANAALRTSNDDLLQFAHVASHDLKEPVRKIKTYTHRLRDDEDNQLSGNSRAYVDKILSSAERMCTMIDGVLTYSSLNGVGVETASVDLNDIIADVKTDLELFIQQKNAVIQHSELPVVQGGKVLLYQLFYNLVGNSLKFSHPDRSPVITISARLDRRDNSARQVITLTDNGIGFETEHAEMIFETFTRLNSKDKYDGTGLGLALCRKIVERHRGSIRAIGVEGKGCTFVIELPEGLLGLVV